jgi:hypothetical protein
MSDKQKGKKLRRCAKHKGYYAAQKMVTLKNKRKRVIKHVRSNPNDYSNREYLSCVVQVDPGAVGLTGKGRKLLRRTAA